MTEIILETDQEIGVATQHVGVNPITGLEMYRRPRKLYWDSFIKEDFITYEQWEVAKDGKVYDELYKIQDYRVCDIPAIPAIPAVYYQAGDTLPDGSTAVGGELKTAEVPAIPAYLNYTRYMGAIGPLLLPPMYATLLVIPMNAPDRYITHP
jgi:hypothetical protein